MTDPASLVERTDAGRTRRPDDSPPAAGGPRRTRIAVVALLAVIGPLLALCHFMNERAPWSSPVRFRGLPPTEGKDPAVEGKDPAVEGKDPAVERKGPAVEGKGPAVEGKGPAVEGKGPAVEGKGPAVEGKGPAVEGKDPGADPDGPAPFWDDVDGLVVIGGDVMQHARQQGEDFDRAYSLVGPVLSRADVAVVNLEFPVHPGRPVGPAFVSVIFNGETAHLAALARAGVDVVSLANNHAFDQGVEGLFETLRQARAAGLRVLGVTGRRDDGPEDALGRSEDDDEARSSPSGACSPLLCEVGGATVAIVAATYDVNLPPSKKKDEEPAPYPQDFPLSILPLNEWWGELASWGRVRIRAGSEAARRRGASSVVAFLHWGREWDLGVLRGQVALARDASSLGLSAIVGSHAHVPGPATTGDGRDTDPPSKASSGGGGHEGAGRPDFALETSVAEASVPVAFGLGNFCSDFREFPTRVGGLVHLGFRKGRLVRWGILPHLVLPEHGDGNPLHVVLPLDETRRDELLAKAKGWGRIDIEEEWERARALVRPLWGKALLPAPPRLPPRTGRVP